MSENNGKTGTPEPQRTDAGGQDQAPEAPLQFRTPVYETLRRARRRAASRRRRVAETTGGAVLGASWRCAGDTYRQKRACSRRGNQHVETDEERPVWRPLGVRDTPSAHEYDALIEGVPAWLERSLWRWAMDRGVRTPNLNHTAERWLRVTIPRRSTRIRSRPTGTPPAKTTGSHSSTSSCTTSKRPAPRSTETATPRPPGGSSARPRNSTRCSPRAGQCGGCPTSRTGVFSGA